MLQNKLVQLIQFKQISAKAVLLSKQIDSQWTIRPESISVIQQVNHNTRCLQTLTNSYKWPKTILQLIPDISNHTHIHMCMHKRELAALTPLLAVWAPLLAHSFSRYGCPSPTGACAAPCRPLICAVVRKDGQAHIHTVQMWIPTCSTPLAGRQPLAVSIGQLLCPALAQAANSVVILAASHQVLSDAVPAPRSPLLLEIFMFLSYFTLTSLFQKHLCKSLATV